MIKSIKNKIRKYYLSIIGNRSNLVGTRDKERGSNPLPTTKKIWKI